MIIVMVMLRPVVVTEFDIGLSLLKIVLNFETVISNTVVISNPSPLHTPVLVILSSQL